MENNWKPDVTVAAMIVVDGRYLLVEEETAIGRRFNQPAGHLELGETLIAAVARETLEEAACVFRPTGLLGVYLARTHSTSSGTLTSYMRFAFVGEAGPRQLDRSLDEGIIDTVWMTIEEVRACASLHRSPLVLQCVEDHHAGKVAVSLDALVTHCTALDIRA